MASQGDDPARPQRASGDARAEAAAVARGLIRTAWKATLSTVAREGGHPYGSLVAVACEPSGAPLLLLSGLAEHTRNIAADSRASLLIDGTSPARAALTGPRVGLVGRIAKASSETARRRYLARHPDAAGFIDFADFALYTLEVEWAHLVAGFGRIVRLQPADVLIEVADAGAMTAAEDSILRHMNEDHADAVAAMAAAAVAAREPPQERESGGQAARWQMIGCDPEGCDLTDGSRAERVLFEQRAATVEQVREAFIALVRRDRGRAR